MISDKFSFNKKSIEKIRTLEDSGNMVGENWPVVYVLNDKRDAYVGETLNATSRMKQHLDTTQKKKLTDIRIITDTDFNKSVILDLESFLIKHMGADQKYNLINRNHGIQNHDYYNKRQYEEKFIEIWNQLISKGVASNKIADIENSRMFLYSPYKSLGDEQKEAEIRILQALAECQNNKENATILVNGGAGTGKTILAIYLMKLIADINNATSSTMSLADYIDEDAESVFASECLRDIKKIGIVFPQSSLNGSIKNVFRYIKPLKTKMVLTPNEVVKEYIASGSEPYDLLIVDEAHRLKCADEGNFANHDSFYEKNKELGFEEKEGTELDWMFLCSKNLVLFRDEKQCIRPCDIKTERFKKICNKYTNDRSVLVETPLETQWRCNGGNKYIKYINNIFIGKQDKFETMENYEFKLFEDVSLMENKIKELDQKNGLCRNVAGFAWKWVSKNDSSKFDIFIDGNKYQWNNKKAKDWIISDNAVNEIGCIHKVQGYDLNYVGVIIGNDIYYDEKDKKIKANRNNYYDTLGKAGCAENEEELRKYIINIYLTLMTRGMKGTFLYVCDEALRNYMKKFVEVAY